MRVKHRRTDRLIKIPKNQTRHAISLLFFRNKIALTRRNLSLFEQDAMFIISTQ